MTADWILTGLVGFVIGSLSGYVVGVTYTVKSLTRQSRSSRGMSRAPDPDPREDDPLFSCEYHGRSFYDRDEARQHAIEQHNAPRDGEFWEQTYAEGRE